MDSFSLLLKPASADCNLRCAYCFYLDHASLYPGTAIHRMSDDILEKTVSAYLKTNQPNYTFGWQGGEPTVMGVDFFRKVIDLQKRYGQIGSTVSNGLQTNATLIDDEFAAFLAEYRFLMGVSVDGPPALHDHYRTSADGRSSHDRVMRGIEHLRRHKAEFNILTLVSAANVNKPADVYRYLKDQGFTYLQFIPCVEIDNLGTRTDFSISGEQWGSFLCAVFDEWVKRDTSTVSIRLFDAAMAYLIDGRRIVCTMGNNCQQYFVIEHNGDVYPCDFFVKPDLKLGNIALDGWNTLAENQKFIDFGRNKSVLALACQSCAFRDLCVGDCQKHRTGKFSGGSQLCAGWKMFYKHALPRLQEIADDIRRKNAAAANIQAATRMPGRNEPCPCGSGRKFKHCCGK